MIVECHAFRAVPVRAGTIRLEIESPRFESEADRMSMDDISAFLGGVAKKTITNKANAPHDPLPLIRGKGRPFALRSALEAWVANNPTQPKQRNKRRRRNVVAAAYGSR